MVDLSSGPRQFPSNNVQHGWPPCWMMLLGAQRNLIAIRLSIQHHSTFLSSSGVNKNLLGRGRMQRHLALSPGIFEYSVVVRG